MVASDDDRNGACLRNLFDEAPDGWHAAFDAELIDRRVAVIDSLQLLAPVHHRLHVAAAAAVAAKGPRSFAGAAIADAHVDGRADNRDLHLAGFETGLCDRNRQAEKAQGAARADRPSIAFRILGDVTIYPDAEALVARVELDDRVVLNTGLRRERSEDMRTSGCADILVLPGCRRALRWCGGRRLLLRRGCPRLLRRLRRRQRARQ